MIVIGIIICLGTHFAARRIARRWLGIPGVRTLSREAEPGYFATPPGRRLGWRLAGPAAAYALSTSLVLLLLLADGETALTTRKPFGQALAEAAAMPVTGAVRASESLWSDLGGATKTDLEGPVGIAHTIAARPERPFARTRFLLMLLAYPTAFVWPISPFVELLLTPRRRRTG